MRWKEAVEVKQMNIQAEASGVAKMASHETGDQEADTREARQKKREKQKFRIRLIPIWLRLLIVIILLAASLLSGAMVGYGVVGNGDPMDVFHKETWQHPFDVVNKKK